jgi:putative Mg2+ transporter-C (MgtC) family protein
MNLRSRRRKEADSNKLITQPPYVGGYDFPATGKIAQHWQVVCRRIKMDFGNFWQSIWPELYVLFQAIVALLLGGLIGWEREKAHKWAGFRTHMLVCLAAMMFVRVGEFLIEDSQSRLHVETLRTDPVRIIEAIVTGIAFLGAGTIFRDREGSKMRGLTTAASLLITAPIGVAVAINRYVLAVGITLLALFVLKVLTKLEPRFHGDPEHEDRD